MLWATATGDPGSDESCDWSELAWLGKSSRQLIDGLCGAIARRVCRRVAAPCQVPPSELNPWTNTVG